MLLNSLKRVLYWVPLQVLGSKRTPRLMQSGGLVNARNGITTTTFAIRVRPPLQRMAWDGQSSGQDCDGTGSYEVTTCHAGALMSCLKLESQIIFKALAGQSRGEALGQAALDIITISLELADISPWQLNLLEGQLEVLVANAQHLKGAGTQDRCERC